MIHKWQCAACGGRVSIEQEQPPANRIGACPFCTENVWMIPEPKPISGRKISTRELVIFLQGCDPEHDVWVTDHEDMDFDTEAMSLVTGYAYEDQDDEMSRSSGRKLNGQPFLRRPILRIEKND